MESLIYVDENYANTDVVTNVYTATNTPSRVTKNSSGARHIEKYLERLQKHKCSHTARNCLSAPPPPKRKYNYVTKFFFHNTSRYKF